MKNLKIYEEIMGLNFDKYTVIIDNHLWCMSANPDCYDGSGACAYIDIEYIGNVFVSNLLKDSIELDRYDLPETIKDKIIELLINFVE